MSVRAIPILVGLLGLALSVSAPAQRQQTFLCEDSPLDIYPDQRFECEAMQNFRKGFDKQALGLLKRAALWGSKGAQYKVGLMYLGGYGALPNPVEGTAWLLLANERNRFQVTEALADAMRQLSAYEVGLARSRARELRSTYGDDAALERRARWVRKVKRETTGSRLGRPMASVRIQGASGVTMDQHLARIEYYEAQLRDLVGTVEYRDFQVIEDDSDDAGEPR